MKIINIITLVLSLAALGLSTLALRQPPKRWVPVVKATPKELAQALYSEEGGSFPSYGDRIFRERHKAELVSSLVISDIISSDDNTFALVFVRFEIGGKAFREAFWARNLNGEWLAEYVSTYRGDRLIQKNKDWIEALEKKKEEWESTSASVYYTESQQTRVTSVRRTSVEKAILNNLRQLAAAVDQVCLETGVDKVKMNQIVGPDKYIKQLTPVDGEDYGKLDLNQGVTTWTIISGSGIAVTYNK